MDQKLPKVFARHSIKVEVEKGKTYFWCSCGLSKNQPFCDSSHVGTTCKPVAYTATEDRIVGFCGCKYTKNAPICDGFHRQLEEDV
jgi:CDGSH-type Zn-finger protein